MKIEEHKQFLIRQRERGRPICILGVDMKLTCVEKCRTARQEEKIKISKQEKIINCTLYR